MGVGDLTEEDRAVFVQGDDLEDALFPRRRGRLVHHASNKHIVDNYPK